MKLNKELDLGMHLFLLNQMVQHETEHDADGEAVLFIAVKFEECKLYIRKMLATKQDYIQYIDEYLDDEGDIDIVQLWTLVCVEYREVFIDWKKKKFGVKRWYHGFWKELKRGWEDW